MSDQPKDQAPEGRGSTPTTGAAARPEAAAAQPAGASAEAGAEEGRKRSRRAPRPPRSGYRADVPFQRLSATKIRRIADNVRRKRYVDAIALLDVLPHKGARLLRKLIQSAAANALAKNKNLDEQMLYVKELMIDVGPTMKRMWARGRGRADRLLKRSCHISVVVDEIGAKEVPNGSEG